VNIGIDARPLSLTSSGIPRYLSSIVHELERIDHENNYFLYSRFDFGLPFENSRWHKRIHPRVPFLFGHGYLRGETRGPGLDIFWATRHIFPFGIPPTAVKLLTVYDFVWRFFPHTMELGNYAMHRLLCQRSIRSADSFITISEATRQSLVDVLGSNSKGISVIYPGVDSSFRPCDGETSSRLISQHYGTSEKYVCTVGTIEPRKNLITLIKALRVLCDRGPFPYQLLIAGQPGWKSSEIYASVERCGLTEREIKFVGRVRDEDLPAFYSGARVFVLPSLYEGFGIPLVEAMACGVPIVASRTSSVPEVVEDALSWSRPSARRVLLRPLFAWHRIRVYVAG